MKKDKRNEPSVSQTRAEESEPHITPELGDKLEKELVKKAL
jgi:hypothetical protein